MAPVKIGAQQPYFLPDFFYFYKIFLSDNYLISDFLGFRKQSPIVRADFGDFLLTIPVHHHQSNPHPPISEVKMVDQKMWGDKQLKTLKSRYSSLPYFEHFYPDLVGIFHQDQKSLNQFLRDIIIWQLAFILPDKNVQVCSQIGIENLENLQHWLGQFPDIQWLVYPDEELYYRNHFTKANLVGLSDVSLKSFPASYKPSMSLLVLLFLKGPETIIYFD